MKEDVTDAPKIYTPVENTAPKEKSTLLAEIAPCQVRDSTLSGIPCRVRTPETRSLFQQLCDTRDPVPQHWDLNSPHVAWWSPYGLSSFTYLAIAILMLTAFSGNFQLQPEVKIPIQLQAACVGFQSFATMMADVVNFGTTSYWQPFDRVVAVLNTGLVAANMVWISWLERALFLLTITAGVSLLLLGRDVKRDNGSITRFTVYHSLWHLTFPLGLLLWMLYREDWYPMVMIMVHSGLCVAQMLYAVTSHVHQLS